MSYKKYGDLGKNLEQGAEKDKKNGMRSEIRSTKKISSGTKKIIDSKKDLIFHLEHPDHLNKLLKKHRLIIVDTWANWCGPCKKIAPHFEQLAKIHKDKDYIIFTKDNIDNEHSPHREIVSAIPTFFFYFEGKKQDKLTYTGADITHVEKSINKIIDFCRKNPK